MKYHVHILAILGVALTLGACTSSDETVHALVVEGFIADGEYPKICLMQTVSPEQTGNSLADMIVRWGRVSLSDGTDSLLLTGGPDKSYFPPYTYTTYEMQGRRGRTYSLEAEYDGMLVKASSTIPEPVPIDSVIIRPVHAGADEYRISLYLTARRDSNEYFRVMARVRGIHDRLLPAFMGVAESAGKGGALEIAVNRPKTAKDTTDYRPVFTAGETVEIALCTLEKEAYQFWLDYENAVAFSGSQFLAPATPLRSNIAGGYGCFFGYGMTRATLTLDGRKEGTVYKLP